ncbi:MAG: glycosyltransferase family 4 protein [Candidatus Limnocylindrales bacterium]
MRRLLILAESLGGGLGVAAVDQAEWFTRHGWHVTVAAPTSVPAPPGIDYLPWSLPRSTRDVRGMFRAARELQRWLARRPAPVIHAHGVRSFAAARLASRGPVFVTLHGLGPMRGDAAGYGRLREIGQRLTPHLAAGAIVAAPSGVPGWRFLPHASPSLREMEAVSASPTSDVPTFMWLGRLSDPKDPVLFVRAIAEVARARPIRGLVVGEGPDRPMLEALITQLGVDVRLVGQVDGIADLMSEAWAVALFSVREGVPFALQEAMWAGRPVVASRLPGTAWLVRDGGFLVDDLASAAAAFEALTDPARTTALGRQAALTVRRLITPDAPWPALAELYERSPERPSG